MLGRSTHVLLALAFAGPYCIPLRVVDAAAHFFAGTTTRSLLANLQQQLKTGANSDLALTFLSGVLKAANPNQVEPSLFE
jgi:hypothetical protein